MRICFFNSTQVGSTGQIVLNIATKLRELGHEVMCVFGLKKADWGDIPCLYTLDSQNEWNYWKIRARLNGSDGFVNARSTFKALEEVKKFSPDVIHLHNVHGEWLDVSAIADFAIEKKIPVLWTAHDCWLATGRCAYFSFNGCDRYKGGCGKCPFKKSYPKVYWIDSSSKFWHKKRELLSRLNPTILTPSNWLKSILEDGGLKNDIYVVGNPIDASTFNCRGRSLPNVERKKTIGFCSFGWTEEKGLRFACKLAESCLKKGIGSIFVGLPANDSRLPKGAKAIARTNNVQELACFYRDIDLFVNTTLQDVLSNVNLEALMTGTPVVTFNSGGAAEMIEEGVNGFSVPAGNLEALINKVSEALELKWDNSEISKSAAYFSKEAFIERMLPFYEKKASKGGAS